MDAWRTRNWSGRAALLLGLAAGTALTSAGCRADPQDETAEESWWHWGDLKSVDDLGSPDETRPDETQPDETQPDEYTPPPLECRAEGLFMDGILMVPSDPMRDPSPECTSSSIQLDGQGGYQACCDDLCCVFTPEEGTGGNGVGLPCSTDDDCDFGLVCNSGVFSSGTCGYAGEGEPCGNDVFCGQGLYCGASGKCTAPADTEGADCFGSDQGCAWPMRCVCWGLTCQCLDGSKGDSCQSDTCAAGLYCANMGPGTKPGTCFEGVAGDPCLADWQCDPGLGCDGTKNGKPACAEWLEEGEDCSDAGSSALAICEPGLICLSFTTPPVCAAPGEETEKCAQDGECQDGLFCNSSFEQCVDGMDGDFCTAPSQCKQGQKCLDLNDGPSRCMAVLAEGTECSDLPSPWWTCEAGTACLYSLSPPACGKPVGEGGICLGDDECGTGLHCLETMGICISGAVGKPCKTDDWCFPDLQCMGLPKACSDGGQGSPCDAGKCTGGLVCDPVLRTCSYGGLGANCVTSSDCQGGMQCMLLWDGGTCVKVALQGDACGTEGSGWEICGEGLFCADPPGECSGGMEEQGCQGDEQCVSGLKCHPGEHRCYAGDLGDPCSAGFPCAPGFQCDSWEQTCQPEEAGGEP